MHCSVADINHAEASDPSCLSWVISLASLTSISSLEAWYTHPPAGVGFAGTTSEMKVGQKWVTSASWVEGHS